MEFPDIWQFESPKRSISFQECVLNERGQENIIKRIFSHKFNKLVSIVLPETSNIPEEISAVFADTDHYEVQDLKLIELINHQFIQGFVARGNLYAISINTRIDIDDCVTITPDCILHLTLNKEVYQSLGLEGKLSIFSKKYPNRYIIKINLNELIPTTKYYERVKAALSNNILTRFSIKFNWLPPDGSSICPSSIAKYFSNIGYEINVVTTKCKTHCEYNLTLPLFGKDNKDKNILASEDIRKEFYCSYHELVEYVGMLTLSCNLKQDGYLNSYSFNGYHSINITNSRICQWNGFFTCDTIIELLMKLKNFIINRPTIPWISLYCHGFPNTTISFGTTEHHFGWNGDNSYIIFLTSDLKCLWYQIK